MRRNRRVGKSAHRTGFTLIELLVVVAIIALLISILLPSLARARELSKRTVCASNMKGMGTGFYTYSTENNDMWPEPAPHVPATATATNITGAVNYYRQVGASGTIGRGPVPIPAPGTPVTTAILANTRALWELVRAGGCSPKSFWCPSSNDSYVTEDNPQDYYDFTIGSPIENTVSYGYQVPFGTKGKPSNDCDQRMPLAADKGPYGQVSETANSMTINGVSYGSVEPIPAAWDENRSPDDWMPYNSPNHGGPLVGEGQVVLFADSHAEFLQRPIVGVGRDNIYTAWRDSTLNGAQDRHRGRRPLSSNTMQVPQENTDSLIYP